MAWIEKRKGFPRGTAAAEARRSTESKLSRSRLAALLSYDEASGRFRWQCQASNRVKAGQIAGRVKPSGYRVITIDTVAYCAHRLAWLYTHKTWPDGQIDHINGIRDDNRIANLRDVTPSQNQGNRRRAFRNNRLGVLGVCEKDGMYRASIGVHGKIIEIGRFKTIGEASAAYLEAKRCLHPMSPAAEGR